MLVGVLAFQGDVVEHHAVLHSLGVPSIDVRSLKDLSKVGALIIPGGESTVIARFLYESGVGEEMIRRVTSHKSQVIHPLCVFGTCAGAIVLAKKVTGKNAPRGLGLIDVTIDRNAYGSQVDSFEATLAVKGLKKPVDVAFIRAPKITRVGNEVVVLAEYAGDPVLARQGRVLIATCHPEVCREKEIHAFFLAMIRSQV